MSDRIRLTNPDAEQDQSKIAARIGDAYKQWHPMDIITVSSPTGSGKTYFILHTLLEWVINEHLQNHVLHQIVYFVNRKILKKQLEDELKHKIQTVLDQNPNRLQYYDYITILTYQEVQEQLKIYGTNDEIPCLSCKRDCRNGGYGTPISLECYAFIVYDECHYFLSDSTFNPETQLAFDYLTRIYDREIQLFMSATITDMEQYIEDRYCKRNITTANAMCAPYINAPYLPIPFSTGIRASNIDRWKLRHYSGTADYSLIKLHAINDSDEIPYLLTDKEIKGKWLIFVDDKDDGKRLCNLLDNNERLKDNVIFLDAEYEDDEEASRSVDEIVTNKASSKQIVICTSVLDNGVSFFDKELRNIVVLTDMQEEFLQMLGRKRFDGIPVDLYICKRTKSFFSKRLTAVTVTRDIIDKYRSDIENWNNYIPRQKLVNGILKTENLYRNMRKFCFSCVGELTISRFSVARLAKMEAFYSEMKEKMEDNNDAFLAVQASWLGKSLGEVERLHIKETPEWKKERINKVVNELELVAGKELDGSQNKELRSRIRKPLQELLKEAKDYDGKIGKPADKEIETIGRGTISVDTFSRIAKYFELPFTMEKPDGSHFVIHKVG